jgi:hypothetical protein
MQVCTSCRGSALAVDTGMHIHVTAAATIKHAFQLSELHSALDTSFAADARAERREVTVPPISRVLFSSSSRVTGSGCFPLTLRLVFAKRPPSSSLLRVGAPRAATAQPRLRKDRRNDSPQDRPAIRQRRATPPTGQPERIHAST